MGATFLQWLDDRTGLPALFRRIACRSVPARRGGFRFVPAMILFGFVLQAVTGTLLWMHYSPSAQSAWESLFYIQFVLPGGWMIRGVHHFSAQLLIVLIGVDLLGLVFRGRYRTPREFVFWSTVVLLLLALGAVLTGDLLSWTLSGYSATLVRVRFLQMLPRIGEPLFCIVAGGPEFGTLTLPRFLAAHILLFGGGFFAVMLLGRFFDRRAASLDAPAAASAKPIPFWSNEALKASLACLLFSGAVLLPIYQKPILGTLRPDWVPVRTHLPREASLGVRPGVPADPADFDNAARPEWSFRALYYFAHLQRKGPDGGIDVFSGERKYIPIFGIPAALLLYALLMPLLGRLRIGHYFNLFAASALLLGIAYGTYASYRHDEADPSTESFRRDRAEAERRAERAVELALAPAGIPPTGALTLIRRDPLTRGPELYARHCASCHPFTPQAGDMEHPDFKPIPCEKPSAPNLYDPIRKKWISGFFDARRIRGDDYFGRTKFQAGTMVGYVRGEMKNILDEEDENEKRLDGLIDMLLDEARRDKPRIETSRGAEGLSKEKADLIPHFGCGRCHLFYTPDSRPVIPAPDLRGYMSRDWMIGIVADPTSNRFYGPSVSATKGNDRMQAFHPSPDEAIMSLEEIETVVDWLRGTWYRFEKRTPDASGDGEPRPVPGETPPDPDAGSAVPLTPLPPVRARETSPAIPTG